MRISLIFDQKIIIAIYAISCVCITYANFWPFIVGDRLFYHDSLIAMTTMGIFYDRIFSGDSWLWSTSMQAGHPIWMAIETTPFWDPVAIVIYGISAVFNADWQTPYQLTVFAWLLIFALGGSACARQITRSEWAGLLAFLLLYGGPMAHSIPAQSLGFILPFRYFPVVLHAYICLRREVTARHSLTLSTALAFSLAGFNSAYALFLLIVIAGSDFLVNRREYLMWTRQVFQSRYVFFFLIPLLSTLPVAVVLYKSRDFVIIPRTYFFGSAYFVEFSTLVSQLLYYMIDRYQNLMPVPSYHGSAFFGHLALPLLVHGLQRSIRSTISHARHDTSAWSSRNGPPILVISLVISTVLACGGLGLENYVRAEGILLGVRNYGFLLTGFHLLVVLLIAYGFSEILYGRFKFTDFATCTIVYGVGAVLFAWFLGFGEFDISILILTIATFSALCFMIMLLRAKTPHVGLTAATISIFIILENGLYVNWTILSYQNIGKISGKEVNFEEILKNRPRFLVNNELFLETRNFEFDYGPYFPYVFLAPAVYKISTAFIEPTYDNLIVQTNTYLFHLKNFEAILTENIEEGQRQQILGVTRPILELVPMGAVREEGGAWNLILGSVGPTRQPSKTDPNSSMVTLAESLGTTRVIEFSGDRILVDVKTHSDTVLIYRDNYAYGWSVRVDDQRAELLAVDRVNKAVAVPAGQHRVKFVYRPWLYLGAFALRAVLLLIAGIVCGSLAVRHWRDIGNERTTF